MPWPDAGSRRLLAIVNPEAGRGRAETKLRRLLQSSDLMERASVEVATARSVEEVCDALARREEDVVPVAVGGDGTVNMVATALDLVGPGAALVAVLPLGTMNLVARELGLGSVRRALQALTGQRTFPLDVMRTSHSTTPLAISSLSGGFEGTFVARYQNLRRFGRPVGALAGLAASGGRFAPAMLELDGEVVAETADRVFSAGLYNARHYPLRVVMSPDADLSDGLGEGVVYHTGAAFWSTVAAGFRGGAHGERDGVTRRTWSTARLESEGPIQIDGESVEGGSISVRLEPCAFRVLVP